MKISDAITKSRAPGAVPESGGIGPDPSGAISYEKTGEFLSNAVAQRNRTIFKKAMIISSQARQNTIAQNNANQAAIRQQRSPRPVSVANASAQRRAQTDSRTEKRRDLSASASATTAPRAAAQAEADSDGTHLLSAILQQQREVLEQQLRMLDLNQGEQQGLLQRHDETVQEGKDLAARMQQPEQATAMREFRELYHDRHQLEPSTAQQIVKALAGKFESKDQFFMALDNLRLATGTRMRLSGMKDLGALSCEAYAEGAAFHLIQSTFKIAGRLRAGIDNAVSLIVEPVGDDDEQEKGRRRSGGKADDDTDDDEGEERKEEGGGHADSR